MKKNLLSFFKSKIQLRNILYKVLPKKLVDRKKSGFNPPLDKFINDLGKERILRTISKQDVSDYLNFQGTAEHN